nr:TELO2-interacting protein 1 homolog [Lytechinus pictus]
MAFYNDYIQTLNKAEDDLANLDDVKNLNTNKDEDILMDEPHTPKQLPLHIDNVKQVLNHCVHVMSSSNPRLRLQVLTTVQSGIQSLHQHQDVLLPLVHKLWPSFVLRFTDQETLVTCKTFSVQQAI